MLGCPLQGQWPRSGHGRLGLLRQPDPVDGGCQVAPGQAMERRSGDETWQFVMEIKGDTLWLCQNSY